MVGGVVGMKFPDSNPVTILVLAWLVSLLIIFIWPKKVRKARRRIYRPDPEEEKRRKEVEKIIAEHQAWWDELERRFVKAGWRAETVDEWEYIWPFDKYFKDKTDWP